MNVKGFILCQLPGQYRLFGIPFKVQTNCFHFFEHILAKCCQLILVSYILAIKNEKIFFFHYRYLAEVKKVPE